MPSCQFLVQGSIQMYPRSGYWCRGTSAQTTLPFSRPVFTRPFFLSAPFARHPSSSPFLGTFFALFSPQKRALFCRARGTAQSLQRGSLRINLCTNFGKEIPSRNLREKRSVSKPPILKCYRLRQGFRNPNLGVFCRKACLSHFQCWLSMCLCRSPQPSFVQI